MNQLFTKLDLSGLDIWIPHCKKRPKPHQRVCSHLSMGDMDLGKTSVIKHTIKVIEPIPFRDRHRRIHPSMFEEVRKHLKEMLEIMAIRKSNSPWVSSVVLVRKKDGSLKFCIDLRRLNVRTVKDA